MTMQNQLKNNLLHPIGNFGSYIVFDFCSLVNEANLPPYLYFLFSFSQV